MREPVIAIICDFDDTLGPDMFNYLLGELSIPIKPFWNDISKMVKNDHWDPTQAYLTELLRRASEKGVSLTKRYFRELGQKLPLFQGLPEFFPMIKKFVREHSDIKNYHINVEFYIVSSGIEEMIRGTSLAKHITGIFACNFSHKVGTGKATAIKSAITFTEKTRFVYAINKGISPIDIRSTPYHVNDSIEKSERRIGIESMIYLGDGPSDIPCMSMIQQNGGEAIGVTPEGDSFKKGYELAHGKRTTLGPYTADYRSNSDLVKSIKQVIVSKGADIGIEQQKCFKTAPKH